VAPETQELLPTRKRKEAVIMEKAKPGPFSITRADHKFDPSACSRNCQRHWDFSKSVAKFLIERLMEIFKNKKRGCSCTVKYA